jgi:predicted ferric reductase
MGYLRKHLAYVVCAVPFLTTAVFWWRYTVHSPVGNQFDLGLSAQLIALGSLAGLLAATGALVQVVLISGAKWLERHIGLDRLTVVHACVGSITLSLIPVHVFLVTKGHAVQNLVGVGWWSQFATFMTEWEDLLPAAIAVAVFLLVGVTSFPLLRHRLKYEWWYYLHLSVYVAIALAFAHQFKYGNGLTADTQNRAMLWYWYGLYIFAFGNLLFYRFLMPAMRFAHHRFAVDEVAAENDSVTSVHIRGRSLQTLPARAGQFVFVRFLAPGFRWERHPFSLSCMPTGNRLRLTIKNVGDFTARVAGLPTGTPVLIDGPHGALTSEAAKAGKVLLLAGGIGITPMRALAEELASAGRDVILLYGNRTKPEIVFRDELDELAAQYPNLKVIHVLSRPGESQWSGESGHIDEEKLRRLVPDLAEREVYLCGPPPMMTSLRRTLRALGVPRGQVHYERFSL